MINLANKKEYSVLTIDENKFYISNELAKFLEDTNSLNEETILVSTSKNGVISLKIKSLNYSINEPTAKKKNLQLYKKANLIIEEKEEEKMKVYVNFMKPKNNKPNPFISMINKVLTSKLKDVEFENMSEVKKIVEESLEPLKTENSIWTIEDNTKTEGLVIKNEFHKEGKEYPFYNMFFINILREKEMKETKE